jgi:hypothetical protein
MNTKSVKPSKATKVAFLKNRIESNKRNVACIQRQIEQDEKSLENAENWK